MVSVTRLDGSAFILNDDLIVTIERTPDTLVWLTTGDRVLVHETPEDLVEKITKYRRELARVIPAITVSGEPS